MDLYNTVLQWDSYKWDLHGFIWPFYMRFLWIYHRISPWISMQFTWHLTTPLESTWTVSAMGFKTSAKGPASAQRELLWRCHSTWDLEKYWDVKSL